MPHQHNAALAGAAVPACGHLADNWPSLTENAPAVVVNPSASPLAVLAWCWGEVESLSQICHALAQSRDAIDSAAFTAGVLHRLAPVSAPMSEAISALVRSDAQPVGAPQPSAPSVAAVQAGAGADDVAAKFAAWKTAKPRPMQQAAQPPARLVQSSKGQLMHLGCTMLHHQMRLAFELSTVGNGWRDEEAHFLSALELAMEAVQRLEAALPIEPECFGPQWLRIGGAIKLAIQNHPNKDGNALAVLAGAAAYVDGLYELQEFAECAPL